jgi:hypothetical protein
MGRRVTNGTTGNIGSSISGLSVIENRIITVEADQNLELYPNGTGDVVTINNVMIDSSTASTAFDEGALVVSGGVGIAGAVHTNSTIADGNGFETASTHLTIPAGTTAQRPGSVSAGFMRFNTDYGLPEVYNGTSWTVMGFKDVDVTSSRTSNAYETNWINTASGGITVTLPASPSKGDRIRFFDVAKTFDSNALTVGRNGQVIQGDAADMTVNTEGAAFELVYYNASFGWRIFTI